MDTEEAGNLNNPRGASWLEPEDRCEAFVVPTSQAEHLTREQEEIDETNSKERQKKAYEAARAQKRDAKEREANYWEQQYLASKARALKEGVVEPEDWGGVWWAQLPDGTWKECSGKFYCVHCSKHLNEITLEVHINSDGHQRKLAWLGQGQGEVPSPQSAQFTSASASTAPGVTPRLPTAQPSVPLQDRQERAQKGHARRPLRSTVIGEGHPDEDHGNRLDRWQEPQGVVQRCGYPEPELPYLAYVPSDESDPSSERWMKCLLCRKWLNDSVSHSGTFDAPNGSKEHQKNLRNYRPGDPWYEERVTQERLRWHPPANGAEQHRRQPSQGAEQHRRQPSQPPATDCPFAAGVDLPTGWEAARDSDERIYYFNRTLGKSQWKRPSLTGITAPPPPRPPSPPPLPPGWTMHKHSNGKIYYHNAERGESRWQLPEPEAGPEPGEVPTPFGHLLQSRGNPGERQGRIFM